jgi:hypothetical protein
VIIDLSTRFVEAYALRSKTSDEVLRGVREWAFRYSFPTSILLDNDPAYKGGSFKEWSSKQQIVLRFTPIYSPQSNGAAERAIRTISEGLRALFIEAGSTKRPVSDLLPIVLFRINRQLKDGQALCPRDQVFCFTERCPVLLSYLKPPAPRGGTFEPGERVWIKSGKPILDKLESRFHPEGVVVEQTFKNAYLVKLSDGSEVVLNEDRLKLAPKANPADQSGPDPDPTSSLSEADGDVEGSGL